ncbi:cytochrome c [Sulfuricella sp.]|uniref:c-type cytochrome n=1 Tax=Sulfuricella sp. TaxID=2099377 RepID=UPI002C75DD9B|nr:cytochrome c [Sulfuricella sp.]HUX65483.1 cytochrome c [Sulfuricella sp.]
MKFITVLLSLLLVSMPALADPFPKGDAKIGKTLHDKSCISCHVSMTGGDGSAIYSRLERKVKNPQQLQARIRTCNANVGANWFPDEENHVAAYLNLQYYHFK